MKKMSDKYIDINQPIKYNRFTNNFRWINMSLFDGFQPQIDRVSG